MARNSEFIANLELTIDREQRERLARNDARARETLRRALVTRNDRRRAKESRRAKVAGIVGAVLFAVLAGYTLAGAVLGA